jgi:hypothetical protein
VDGTISCAWIDANSTVDSDDLGDYFVLETGRTEIIEPARLTWQIDYVLAGNAKTQLMSAVLPVEANADVTGDGKVNFGDFARLAVYWLDDEPSVDIAPAPYGDGLVDMDDLAVLVEQWLEGN